MGVINSSHSNVLIGNLQNTHLAHCLSFLSSFVSYVTSIGTLESPKSSWCSQFARLFFNQFEQCTSFNMFHFSCFSGRSILRQSVAMSRFKLFTWRKYQLKLNTSLYNTSHIFILCRNCVAHKISFPVSSCSQRENTRMRLWFLPLLNITNERTSALFPFTIWIICNFRCVRPIKLE